MFWMFSVSAGFALWTTQGSTMQSSSVPPLWKQESIKYLIMVNYLTSTFTEIILAYLDNLGVVPDVDRPVLVSLALELQEVSGSAIITIIIIKIIILTQNTWPGSAEQSGQCPAHATQRSDQHCILNRLIIIIIIIIIGHKIPGAIIIIGAWISLGPAIVIHSYLVRMMSWNMPMIESLIALFILEDITS